jgi:DNA-directed RNA polymerase sigma subunit (sigma70/sigma32)
MESYLPDENSKDAGDQIHQDAIIAAIKKAMCKLTPREQKVLRLRFGITETDNSEEWQISQDEFHEIALQTMS